MPDRPLVLEVGLHTVQIAHRAGAEKTIGRDPSNDIPLDDTRVSRQHAVIRPNQDGSFVLQDLGSLNGTHLNGRRLEMPATLRDQDEVRIGDVVLRVTSGGQRPLSAPAPTDEVRTAGYAPGQDLPLLGEGPAMQEVFRLAERAAKATVSVLLHGETGTGKELVARGIHGASPRSDGPFVSVNCAALPLELAESTLFGHRRGAFTGATEDQEGLFESAHGGTLLLDEVGEMPLEIQPKLLRALQEGAVTRVGETSVRTVDVRIVAATNRDLQQGIDSGRFRSDLFYRLAAFRIRVPPLRERLEDLPLLAGRLVDLIARREGRKVKGLAPAAMDRLLLHTWPGNVRELRNELERAVAVAPEHGWIGFAELSDAVRGVRPSSSEATRSPPIDDHRGADLRSSRAEFEAKHIAEVLRDCGGNATEAARRLGLSRSGLNKKLREYGLLRDDKR